MNIWIEVDKLPRRSQIALAAALLREARPTIQDLAIASGINLEAVRRLVVQDGKAWPEKRAGMAGH